jgi:outer membrane protein insertion porin family
VPWVVYLTGRLGRRIGTGLAALLLLLSTPAGSASAQAVVREVRVEGAQRVDPDTVRSYITLRTGDRFDEAKMDASLKALFGTGFFADVIVRPEGDALVVRVVENPIINRIAFEGNSRIDDKTLEAEVQLRPRTVYTRTRVQSDVTRILDVYRRSGRFAASVEPKIITLPQNRVDLVFEINEGQTTYVDRIVFVGNKRFSDGQLRSEIQTEEYRWYKFLSSDDVYDPDRLAYDRELLRKFYLSKGYADFRVVSAVAELLPERTGFVVNFTVEEGPRYSFGTIDAASALPDLNVELVRQLITTRQGDWYNADAVDKTIEALTDEVGRLGYAFVEVKPKVNRDRDTLRVDVTYEIGEGPRVYVDRIEIEGNVRTLDRVVRREFRLQEGDAFNTAKIRRTRQRLRNLGYFEKVEVTNVQGEEPDRTVIKVDVTERSTGELSLGAGFSSSLGPLADIGIRERNLLGRGQDLRVGLSIAQLRQQADISFTEPYFLGRNLSAGADAFSIRRDLLDQSSFRLNTTGASLRTGYRLTESLRQSLRYTARVDDIIAGSDTSRFIRDQEGAKVISLVGQELSYDKRDNRFDPSDGYIITLGTDFAGLAGDISFARAVLKGNVYFPLGDQVVLGLGGRTGYIVGLGQDTRINDRFLVGGEDFRGFELGGVGARDAITNDALGGTYYTVTTTELGFPLGLPKEFNIRGRVFTDIGTVGGFEFSGPEVRDANSIRASVGFGVTYVSPFGPLRLDIAQPVIKEDFDKVDRFLFSFGTRF